MNIIQNHNLKITRKSFSPRASLLFLRMRSKTKRSTMIWTHFFHTDLIFAETDDGCRHIVWNQPVQDKLMQGNVIRSMEVPHEGSCKVICYMEPNCVSINVRPATQGGNFICELNNAKERKRIISTLSLRYFELISYGQKYFFRRSF